MLNLSPRIKDFQNDTGIEECLRNSYQVSKAEMVVSLPQKIYWTSRKSHNGTGMLHWSSLD